MCAYLHAFAVIEQDITELFGHHVQVPLLALMGPSQDVEFGEVGRQIIERPRGKQETCIYAAEKCWKHLFYLEDKGALTVWWWRRGHRHLGTQRGLLYIQTAASSLRVEAWKRTETKCLLTFYIYFTFFFIYNRLRVNSFHLLAHELSATHPHIPSGLAPASWPTEAPSGVSSASLATFSSWLFPSTFSVEPSGGRCGVSPGDGASLEQPVWAAELDSLESFLSWRWKRRRMNGQRTNRGSSRYC